MKWFLTPKRGPSITYTITDVFLHFCIDLCHTPLNDSEDTSISLRITIKRNASSYIFCLISRNKYIAEGDIFFLRCFLNRDTEKTFLRTSREFVTEVTLECRISFGRIYHILTSCYELITLETITRSHIIERGYYLRKCSILTHIDWFCHARSVFSGIRYAWWHGFHAFLIVSIDSENRLWIRGNFSSTSWDERSWGWNCRSATWSEQEHERWENDDISHNNEIKKLEFSKIIIETH